jgi:ankyrin repeat protein
MEASVALALLSGGSIELDRLNDELSDELCAALRARAPSGGEGVTDFEGRNSTGETPFLLACTRGNVECMQLLAKAGYNTAAITTYGSNALMLAAQSGVAAAVRAALAAGWCELEARDNDDCTAFLLACDKGHVECMQVLAQAGCNTAVINNYGMNALMCAACSGVAAAVRTALAAGWCELEARADDGSTAFHVACFKGTIESMQLLAEAGCNTAAKDNCNRTATDFVKVSDNSVEAIQWLRQRDTANTVATLLQESQELLASSRLSEAKTIAEKACSLLSSLPGNPELDSACTALRDAIQNQLTKDLELRECRARVAEAELMAMLDAESTATNRSVEQTQKAQRKKEKRRKQQQAKRQAAARRAEALTDPVSEQLPEQATEAEPGPEQVTEAEPVVQPEPEPDEQQVPLSPAVSAPESPCAEAESDGALTSVRTAPDEFCCPITSECMRDPVIMVATGMTYEREAIAEWLCEHDIDPSTGIKLGENKQLTPNVALRKMIDAWSHGCLLMYSRD